MLLSFCEGNASMTSGFPPQRNYNAENVSIWWRHNVVLYFQSHIPCTVLVDIVDGQSDLQRQQQQLVDRISKMHTLLDNLMESHGTSRVQFSQSDSFSRNQSSSIGATKTSTPRCPRVAVQLPPIDDDIPMPHDAAMVKDSVSNEQAATSPRQQIVDLDKSTHDSSTSPHQYITDLDRGTDLTTNIARQENVRRINDSNMSSSRQQILADPRWDTLSLERAATGISCQLAEYYFGLEVLRVSNLTGRDGRVPLNPTVLARILEDIRRYFGQRICTQNDFHRLWRRCRDAIGNKCRNLRYDRY